MWNVSVPLFFGDINKNKKVLEWSYCTSKSTHWRVAEFFSLSYQLRGFGRTFLSFLIQNLDLRYNRPAASCTCCLSFLNTTCFQFSLVNYKILIQDSRIFTRTPRYGHAHSWESNCILSMHGFLHWTVIPAVSILKEVQMSFKTVMENSFSFFGTSFHKDYRCHRQ